MTRETFMALLLALGPAGCLLAEPINAPPSAPVISGPDVMARAQPGAFSANAEDADSDALELFWGQVSGACPAPAVLADEAYRGPPAHFGQTPYLATGNDLGPLCVWVLARDENGAVAVAGKTVQVANQAPTAVLARLDSLGEGTAMSLYETVRISGAGSRDPDTADAVSLYTWSLTAPSGAPLPLTLCPDVADGSALCFSPAGPGAHTVTLTVTDGLGAPSAPATLVVNVAEDQPPCLLDNDLQSAFLLRRWDEDVALAVAVEDDGDPFPPREGRASQVRFLWWFRELGRPQETSFSPLLDAVGPILRVPARTFRQGDEIQLRVEVTDRVHTQIGCPPSADRCEAVPMCFQRLTFTVRYWL